MVAMAGAEWLAKALAAAGVASRRSCIELVKQGKVRVNGAVVTDPATRVDAAADVLEVAGTGRLQLAAPGGPELHYFALNKPPGYICSNVSHNAPGKRAADLLQPWLDSWQRQHKGQLPPRLFTVGRLDVATSGLIFLTNDGDWANKVIHPSANILKEYRVTLPQLPMQQQLQLLKAGTTIEGVRVVPKRVHLLQPPSVAAGTAQQTPAQRSSSSGGGSSSSSSRAGPDGRCVLSIEVSEGKKHEVRLLVAAAGLQLLALSRVRVGGWVMPRSLKPGAYLKLQPQELEKVFQQYK
ncbi:hypothetical protein OEZ86_013920 [Tetradesmus obliquus]|nr:hypothetical protein OEZ86_013920 [Tetradesmus obliquus]